MKNKILKAIRSWNELNKQPSQICGYWKHPLDKAFERELAKHIARELETLQK